MKIVVIGAGPISSKLVTRLGQHGHQAVAAPPAPGAGIPAGQQLAGALAGAAVVIDVASPSPAEAAAALDFFPASTRNLLAAEAAAGVRHHVVLSAVGIERLQHSGCFRAKSAQEELIENSAIPYSIVRATQFFEYLPSIADAATDGSVVRLAPVLFQPIAEDDVIQVIARMAAGPPLLGRAEVAGPERFQLDDFFRRALARSGDPRTVATDPRAAFFGIELGERTLLPSADAVAGATRYRDWLDAPAGGSAFLQELELDVRTELIQAETSPAEEEAAGTPIEEWLSDPADDQRYEARLRSLLGAVEAMEDGSRQAAEGW